MAVGTMQGVGTAFAGGKVPREFFDALAMTKAEVDELEFRTNVERAKQEAINKMKSGQLHD